MKATPFDAAFPKPANYETKIFLVSVLVFGSIFGKSTFNTPSAYVAEILS
jgi:hypothetical protein